MDTATGNERRPTVAINVYFSTYAASLAKSRKISTPIVGLLEHSVQWLVWQTRKVRCAAASALLKTDQKHETFVPLQNEVADRLCGEPSALATEHCNIPCPGDCLLSDWSSWSSCSQTCSAGRAAGHRTRFRQIIAVQSDPGNDFCHRQNQL